MKNGRVTFYLSDVNENIPPAAVSYFKISASIHTPFPTGFLILNDMEGRILETLKIRPGNLLQIAASETQTDSGADDPATFFTPMIIVGMENTDSDEYDEVMQEIYTGNKRVATLGGLIKVNLVHPWALYSNWRNEAYLGSESSDKILESLLSSGITQRGFDFAEKLIDKTDDGSNGPNRYKLQESEVDFIENKILPYATSGNEPLYFFVNEQNKLHFQTFKTMLEKEPELTLIAPVMDSIAEREAGVLPEVVTPAMQEIVDSYWYIGRNFKDQVKAMKKVLYTEDGDSKISFKSTMMYRSTIPGYTLINQALITGTEATSIAMTPNRSFEDTIKLSINQTRAMNEFFEIGLITSLCIDVATVGQTIQLQLVGTQSGTAHWINGKWVVTAIEHYQKDGVLLSKLLVAKPTLNPEGSVAGGLDLTEFYKVGTDGS